MSVGSVLLKLRKNKFAKLQTSIFSFQLQDELIREYDEIKYLIDSFSMLRPMHGSIIGRIIAQRKHGGIIFWEIEDHTGLLQVMHSKKIFLHDFQFINECFDLGDIVFVSGDLFRSRKGTLTLKAHKLQIITKSFHAVNKTYFRLKQKNELNGFNNNTQDELKGKIRFVQIFKQNLHILHFLELYIDTVHKTYHKSKISKNIENEIERSSDSQAFSFIKNHVPKVYQQFLIGAYPKKMGFIKIYSGFSSLTHFTNDIESLLIIFSKELYDILLPTFSRFPYEEYLRMQKTTLISSQLISKITSKLEHPTFLQYFEFSTLKTNTFSKRLIEIVLKGKVIGTITLKTANSPFSSSNQIDQNSTLPPIYICKLSLDALYKVLNNMCV